MEKSILFLVPYPYNTAPSQRLKFEQYYPGIRDHQFKISIYPFIKTSFWQIIYKKGNYLRKFLYTLQAYLKRYFLLFQVGRYDIVYVHLWGVPFGAPLYEWLLRKLSKKIVYDIDDLVYKGETSSNNQVISILKSSAKVDYLMKHADRVIVSTDKLAEYASQFSKQISFIPATVDVHPYRPKSEPHDPLIIGWSGSHTTSKYLYTLKNVLKQISGKKNIKIHVMGDPDFAIEGLDVTLIQWTAKTEAASICNFDIGLHPVSDEEWVYGKSGGKLVQYMAAGIPIVATAIGPNYAAVMEGHNGFLVKTDQEWLEKLTLLIEDQKLRRQMGANSRKRAEEIYAVEANLEKYLSIFNQLIELRIK